MEERKGGQPPPGLLSRDDQRWIFGLKTADDYDRHANKKAQDSNTLSLNDVEFVKRPPPPPPQMGGENEPDPHEAVHAATSAFRSYRL